MATEPKKPATAAEPKKPAAAGKAAVKTARSAPAEADLKSIESRLSVLEAGLEAAEKRLAQRTSELEARIGAMGNRNPSSQKVQLPAGIPESVRHGIDRAADLIRHNPITALILIVAFLLVAIFS